MALEKEGEGELTRKARSLARKKEGRKWPPASSSSVRPTDRPTDRSLANVIWPVAAAATGPSRVYTCDGRRNARLALCCLPTYLPSFLLSPMRGSILPPLDRPTAAAV